jgi:hypothetical protein
VQTASTRTAVYILKILVFNICKTLRERVLFLLLQLTARIRGYNSHVSTRFYVASERIDIHRAGE